MPGDDLPFPPATREEALARLEAFLPHAPGYASARNHVVPGHGNVSRLSPATRTRLLLETEIAQAARELHTRKEIEKFEQEIWWRLYWKGWLEMRPSIWEEYRDAPERIAWSDRARQVAAGESGIAIMDHFARELVETGYLHNHSRMWWASFWIHVERLPWQLGADFFFQHLHDGDAASNTLSWRWVAGLHTQGKAYLVRRSNIEKYVDAEILEAHRAGLDRLENAETIELDFPQPPSPEAIPDNPPLPKSGRIGLWVHEEDSRVEDSPLADLSPAAIAGFRSYDLWDRYRYPEKKREFLATCLADATERAARHLDCPSGIRTVDVLSEGLASWASDEGLGQIVAMRPFTGPLADELPAIRDALQDIKIELHLLRRPDDIAAMNRATAGFFGFWKKTEDLRS